MFKIVVRLWPSGLVEVLKDVLQEEGLYGLCIEERTGIFVFGDKSENHGLKMCVPYGFYSGSEPKESAIMSYLSSNAKVVFDIGANLGWYTLLFASKTTELVVAFEPIPNTFSCLEKSVAINNFTNCKLEKTVVSDFDGEMTMYLPNGRLSTIASLHKHKTHKISQYESYYCKSITLDSYMSEHNILHIDLIKCDVEGAELLVLKGAEKLLKSQNAPILLVEAEKELMASFKYTPQDLFEYMESLGFIIYQIVGSDENPKLKVITSTLSSPDGKNFLFAKENKKDVLKLML